MFTLLRTTIISSYITIAVLGAFQIVTVVSAATTATKSAVTAQATKTPAASASPKVSSSPSPTPSSSPEQTAEELKKRIEKVVSEKKDFSDKGGFIGEVTRLSQEALTVKQASGTTIIPLESSITLLKKGKRITAQEIEVGNWVIVIGTKEDSAINPDFIIASTESLRPKTKSVVIGTITSIAKSKVTVVTRGSNEEKVFTIVKNTKYENSDGTTLKVADFEKDLSVLVVSSQEENDVFNITTIRALSDVKADQ